MNFVYRDPDDKRGACRSESILYVHSYHTRITFVVPADKRKQAKAALAISTVAVRVFLDLYLRRSSFIEKPAHRFVAIAWASRAAKYLTIIKTLTDSKWEEINVSAQYSDVGGPGDIVWGDGGDGDDTSEGPDTRLEMQLPSDEEVVYVEVIESYWSVSPFIGCLLDANTIAFEQWTGNAWVADFPTTLRQLVISLANKPQHIQALT
ncbi:hypothetical protein DFH07DRAFT_968149 [Mycena maculata]|uniref:Uncharacterized protein n=1 Tax=Mycena maculata TaxID=230809 RepID=A0AAD7I1T5_9AGAR|nr:hypothetical protein DFH07DRAFT_968149 [Mycena maculata]